MNNAGFIGGSNGWQPPHFGIFRLSNKEGWRPNPTRLARSNYPKPLRTPTYVDNTSHKGIRMLHVFVPLHSTQSTRLVGTLVYFVYRVNTVNTARLYTFWREMSDYPEWGCRVDPGWPLDSSNYPNGGLRVQPCLIQNRPNYPTFTLGYFGTIVKLSTGVGPYNDPHLLSSAKNSCLF